MLIRVNRVGYLDGMPAVLKLAELSADFGYQKALSKKTIKIFINQVGVTLL